MIEAGLHGVAAVTTHGASIPGTVGRVLGAGIKDCLALGLGQRATEKAEQIGPIALNTNPQESIATLLAMEQKRQDDTVARALLTAGGAKRGGQIGSSVAEALIPYATAN